MQCDVYGSLALQQMYIKELLTYAKMMSSILVRAYIFKFLAIDSLR
jgi:hypothetical protein